MTAAVGTRPRVLELQGLRQSAEGSQLHNPENPALTVAADVLPTVTVLGGSGVRWCCAAGWKDGHSSRLLRLTCGVASVRHRLTGSRYCCMLLRVRHKLVKCQ